MEAFYTVLALIVFVWLVPAKYDPAIQFKRRQLRKQGRRPWQ